MLPLKAWSTEVGLLPITNSAHVLIVEDLLPFATKLATFVSEFGYQVTLWTGVESITEGVATGYLPEGDTQQLDLREVSLAFVDFYFVSVGHTGGTVCKALAELGCRSIVGMSSDRGANERMRLVGAHHCYRKSHIIDLLG